jgi:GrpB-like predicted nucleotidyltransferase (UPF0157 family)
LVEAKAGNGAHKSKIVPDSRWPGHFSIEKERAAKSFGAELHNVGSTAVPGLAAKSEKDWRTRQDSNL